MSFEKILVQGTVLMMKPYSVDASFDSVGICNCSDQCDCKKKSQLQLTQYTIFAPISGVQYIPIVSI